MASKKRRRTQPADRPDEPERRAAYWRANLKAIGVLLGLWALAGFGLGIVLVEPLNAIRLGGYPLGFWFAQQGSIFIFIGLIYAYARWMDAIDARYGAARPEGR